MCFGCNRDLGNEPEGAALCSLFGRRLADIKIPLRPAAPVRGNFPSNEAHGQALDVYEQVTLVEYQQRMDAAELWKEKVMEEFRNHVQENLHLNQHARFYALWEIVLDMSPGCDLEEIYNTARKLAGLLR